MLAIVRLNESKQLLNTENYCGAYYLCGYIIELGLKACIAKNIKRFEFPDKRFATDCFTHDLTRLVDLANLKIPLQENMRTDPDFGTNWAITKDWSEESRYEMHDEVEAHEIYRAVAGRSHGVLRWVKNYW